MQATLLFICCKPYDFVNNDGERVVGVKCQCFEPNSKTIVNVKTDKVVNAEFGDEVNVNIVINGRYLNYFID